MADLTAALDDAVAGKGHVFLVGGEPGIGKSRLADEAAEIATRQGLRVVWGRCWEAGGAPSYWPWVQALRSHIRELDEDEMRAGLGAGASFVAQMVPEVTDVLRDVRPPPAMEAEEARFRLFDSVATFLRNSGTVRPLMILLDDLHAADVPSLLLLQFVARELSDARVLILGTYRNVELGRDHPLTFTLAELTRQRATRHLPLFGLTEAEVARLIEQTIGSALSDRVVAAVHRETEGNPLFVGEVVRLLSAEGRLDRMDDPAAIRMSVPEGIREVIRRRLARLSTECSDLLGLASIFGREFSLDALGRLADRPAGDLLDLLDEGLASRVLAEVPGAPGRLRFAHSLIRDGLYDQLGASQRLRLHRRAGETLETHYQRHLEAHLAELAHHFFEAAPLGEADKAVDYAERAGHEALSVLAYEEAVRSFGMALAALEFAEPPDERIRCRLQLGLGDALSRVGDRPSAKVEFRRAAEIARREGMAEELGLAALGYGGALTFERGASDGLVVQLLEDARAILAESGGAVRARVLARLAAALRDQPDRAPRDALSQEALTLARGLDDPHTLAYALAARGSALMGPGDPSGNLAIAEELRTVAKAAQDTEREMEGEAQRAIVLLGLGRVSECQEAVDAMQRLAEELRQPAHHWWATASKANLVLLQGRFAEAEALIELAQRIGVRSQPFDAIAYSRVQRFALRCEDGRLSEIESEIRRSVHEFSTRPLFSCLAASLCAEIGDEDGARALFEPLAATAFAAIPINNDLLLSMVRLVDVALFLHDSGSAAVLYGHLLPYQGLLVDTWEWSTGAVDRSLGLAALATGNLDIAERHFRSALELNTRVGAHPWTTRTQRDLAGLLVLRDRPGDQETAVSLEDAALAAADHLGMTAFAARARVSRPAMGHSVGQVAPERVSTRTATPTVFRREGEYWTVLFATDAFRLRDAKGLHYLAELLAHPGREFHVLDLVGAVEGIGVGRSRTGADREDGLNVRTSSDVGPALDERAKASYRARLRELEEELDEATSWADSGRAARVREEMELLADELTAAVGLGGRDRKPGSPAERARVNITRAIHSTLGRIRDHSAALADHLDATVHTGTFCSYVPDPRSPISWQR
jgi:tetratricopeptide (TPR) repeat protein